MSNLTTCPNCGHSLSGLEHDKRAVRWRFRIRLYDLLTDDKMPQADTDPELDAAAMGTWEAAGLKGVAESVIQVATAFHNTQHLPGLELATLEAKIPGLRPTLSRRGGNAVWRIPFTSSRGVEWLARVDLERMGDEAPVAQPRPMFRRVVT